MDKTLIILGAGASKDICKIFPTGPQLIKEINYHFITEQKISKEPEESNLYLSALMNELSRVFGNRIDLFITIKNKLWDIQLAYEHGYLRDKPIPPMSIDAFIATEIEKEELGEDAKNVIKYCIYYLIKGIEEALVDRNFEPYESWINELAKKFNNYKDVQVINENLRVITFNYDRTFEQYFVPCLKRLNPEQIFEPKLRIEHVYGHLGDLIKIPFSLKNDENDLFKDEYNHIKLMNDRPDEFKIDDAAKYKKVHFMGFGYDEDNLKLINLNRFTSATFHGSGYGLDDSKITELKDKYQIEVINCACLDYVKMKI